jgi:hypothetical protein
MSKGNPCPLRVATIPPFNPTEFGVIDETIKGICIAESEAVFA